MRLWHYKLIPYLPRQQLLGQHRECCAMRGLGWGKKHSVVNYVWKHNYLTLFNYHCRIMEEMIRRGYKVSNFWRYSHYRGKKILLIKQLPNRELKIFDHYPEHTEEYLQDCLENLRRKGINLDSLIKI